MNLKTEVAQFLELYLWAKGGLVAGRLQSAMALLERLRDYPSLKMHDHMASKGGNSLKDHEPNGENACRRWGVEKINKNHGRRSCNARDWGPRLLQILEQAGFKDRTESQRAQLIDQVQSQLAESLRTLADSDPLILRMKGRSPAASIREVLTQAGTKRKEADVAYYLVGATLAFGFTKKLPIRQARQGHRRTEGTEHGDFTIGHTVYEAALGCPDETHMKQIAEALKDAETRFWVLTRPDQVAVWVSSLSREPEIDMRRIDVTAVDTFIGQTVVKLSEGLSQKESLQLQQIVRLYNGCWIREVGSPSISIEARDR